MRAGRVLVLPVLFIVAVAAGTTGCGVPEDATNSPTANWLQVSDGIYRGARPDKVALQKLAALHFETLQTLEDNAAVIVAPPFAPTDGRGSPRCRRTTRHS